MSVRTRLSLVTAATVASALLLAGCGGPSLPSGLFGPPSTGSQAVLPATGGGGSSGGSSGSSGGGLGVMSPDCLGVLEAYSTIALALLPSLTGGTGAGTYDSTKVVQAIAGLGGQVPAALKGDFQTLSDAAKGASGKSLVDAGNILGSPAVSAASDDISKWTDANCGG